jgi:hypothetical protein
MSLPNYENGVEMVKRLRTTGLRHEHVMSSVSCTISNATSVRVENASEHACPTVHYGIQPNFLAASDLPFPIFENVSGNNAALHLKMLDEYFDLKSLQLATATRSLRKPLKNPG